MSETNAPVLIVGGGARCSSHVSVMSLRRRILHAVGETWVLSMWVRPLGLEPRTCGLRVRCSTN